MGNKGSGEKKSLQKAFPVAPTVDELEKGFALLDVNGDGKLDREEVRKLVELVVWPRMTKEQKKDDAFSVDALTDLIFTNVDENRDGFVDLDELILLTGHLKPEDLKKRAEYVLYCSFLKLVDLYELKL